MDNKIVLPKNQGNPILFHAVAHINIREIITLLEDKEADVNAKNINGSTPLHFAVLTGNPTVVQILLKFNADPNIKEYFDVGEKTPIHYAVEKNFFEICVLLLDYGANPSIQDKNGMTALHYSARLGLKEITTLLLTQGVDVNLRDVNGYNASYWAQTNKHFDVLALLPPPLYIEIGDYQEFKNQLREIHQIQIGKKKSKKKK